MRVSECSKNAVSQRQIIEKMNGQGAGAETIPFSVAVKAQGNIEDWLCDLLFKMQVRMLLLPCCRPLLYVLLGTDFAHGGPQHTCPQRLFSLWLLIPLWSRWLRVGARSCQTNINLYPGKRVHFPSLSPLPSISLQLTMKDLTRICAADVANVGSDISRLRGFVDSSYAQFALLGVQLMWTTDVQSALEQASASGRAL